MNGALKEAIPFVVQRAPLRAVTAMDVDDNQNPEVQTSFFAAGVHTVWTVIYVDDFSMAGEVLFEWFEVGAPFRMFTLLDSCVVSVKQGVVRYPVSCTFDDGHAAGEYAVVLSMNSGLPLMLSYNVS